MDELKDGGYKLISTELIVYCKEFEDNSGALEIALLPNMYPRTKAINIIYRQFGEYVRLSLIKFYPMSTNDQVANDLFQPKTSTFFTHALILVHFKTVH